MFHRIRLFLCITLLVAAASCGTDGAPLIVNDTSLAVGCGTNNCNSNADYIVEGLADPAIQLVRGQTYTFNNSVDVLHPLSIRTAPGTAAPEYTGGVTGAGTDTVTFIVPLDAPDTLYYQCDTHDPMYGLLVIVD